tara:strand:- start:189 stop:452 length:264 start_codon:yes stop_codon:yes gene_type:complete
MKVTNIYLFFLVLLLIFFDCDNTKKIYNDIEIIIEKKRIDSLNFEAKVIVRDNSDVKSKDQVYILIDSEAKLKPKIRNLKEKFLHKK